MVAEGRPDKVATKYSRMFMEEQKVDEEEKLDRWGNGKAKFAKIEVLPKKISDKAEPITIQLTVKAVETIVDPIIGFSLKNPTGGILIATNTKIERISVGEIKAKESKTITFKIPNVLSDGKYVLDVAMEATDASEAYDWWEEARAVRVYETVPSPFLVSPAIETSVATTSND